METQKQQEYFNQFQPMLESKAYKYSNIYGVEFQECLSESYYIFVKVCHRYNEELACFSTYLTQELDYKLNNFAQKMSGCGIVMDWPEEIYEQYTGVTDNYEELYFLKETLNSLSVLARKIIMTVFQPEQMMELEKKKFKSNVWTKKITKKSLEKYYQERGYTQRTIRQTFEEIQEALC